MLIYHRVRLGRSIPKLDFCFHEVTKVPSDHRQLTQSDSTLSPRFLHVWHVVGLRLIDGGVLSLFALGVGWDVNFHVYGHM